MITRASDFHKNYSKDKEFMNIVHPIHIHDKFQEMRRYFHHGKVDCLIHSMDVSYIAYRIGKKWGMDYLSLARAGLLHDFYLYDWHEKGDRKGLHGFTHAKTALKNADNYFDLNQTEKDMIRWHMWPLNFGFPRYRESWVLMIADRYCTVIEYFKKEAFGRRMDD